MAVFGAVISYFMQMLSFILLRRKLPNIERPYRSPWGSQERPSRAIIALVSLVSLYLDKSYRPGVVGTAIWFVLGLIYFAMSGRNKLVLSPEEEFALTQGERGTPRPRVSERATSGTRCELLADPDRPYPNGGPRGPPFAFDSPNAAISDSARYQLGRGDP